MIGIVVSFSFFASADQLIDDDLIVNGASDGTAPAYDCSPGATLPFWLPDLSPDPSSATETIPAGDPIIIVKPNLSTCVTDPDPAVPWICEYTCDMPFSAACVGQDCVNGESFDVDTLRLKENNLRIRFHDMTIGDVLGESWNVEANSSQNGGLDYFDFQVKSVEIDSVMISDGTAPAYDCSATGLLPYPFESIGTIPSGEPVLQANPINCVVQNSQYMCEISCEEIPYYTVKSVFRLGAESYNDGVAIGYESTPEDGSISVGRADLLRRIANVAAGINATDALTLEGLAILAQQIADANAELDAIEDRIEQLELGPFIHPSAFVHSRASIGIRTTVEANATVRARATVGENSTIGESATVGRNASVGSNTVVGENSRVRRSADVGDHVSLDSDVTVGISVEIGDNTSVGADTHIRFNANVGSDVEIGTNVIVGSFVSVDNGVAIGNDTVIRFRTTIGAGTVIGENCYIARNVTIGENVTIGNNVRIGRNAVINDGAVIDDGTTIPNRAVVN